MVQGCLCLACQRVRLPVFHLAFFHAACDYAKNTIYAICRAVSIIRRFKLVPMVHSMHHHHPPCEPPATSPLPPQNLNHHLHMDDDDSDEDVDEDEEDEHHDHQHEHEEDEHGKLHSPGLVTADLPDS